MQQRAIPARRFEPPASSLQPPPYVEPLLLVAALLTIAVGGLSMRLGPRWPRRLFFRAPGGVIIHHTATGGHVEGKRVDAALIATWHERRGFSAEYRGGTYHIGYHYVILPDGNLERGRPDWMLGAHVRGYNDYLGICLVGNFDAAANPGGAQQPAEPTREQLDTLVRLLKDLMVKYRLRPGDIYQHCDLAATACPGDRFPMKEVLRRLEQR